MTYQASKKTDFTVDLIWWGSLRLAQLSNLSTFASMVLATFIRTEEYLKSSVG